MNNTLAPGHFFGAHRRERECAGFTAALRLATVPPEDVAEHGHEGAHFVLAVDGGYLGEALGRNRTGTPMTLIYNPPDTRHRDRFARPGGRFLSIDVPAEHVPGTTRDTMLVTAIPARSAAARIAGMIAAGDADEPALEEQLLLVAGAPFAPPSSAHPPPWLGPAAEALADLASDGALQLRDLARAAGVHPVHLARAYRRHFGCGPAEALRRQRLARAAGLLSRPLSLAQIAADSGFADQSHMTRAFRRHYGVTPGQFRAAFA